MDICRQNIRHRKELWVMSRKGENIYKRKDGRWEGRYIKGYDSNNKAIYGYVYAKSYREVKNKMISFKRDIQNGHFQTAQLKEEIVLLQDITNEWLTDIRCQIKDSTYIKYRNMIQSYIIPENYPINNLTIECLNSFFSELLQNGGQNHQGLSAKTVADVLSLVRNMFRYAKAKGVDVPCDAREIIIKQNAREFRIFSIHEQEKLCQYLCTHLSLKNIGILLCLYTGLRIGEICALQWKDISFIENTIYVHQTMQRLQVENAAKQRTKLMLTTPKSPCSIRVIPIPEDIVNLLKNTIHEKQGYMLTCQEDYCIEPRTLQNHFKRILKETGIKETNFHTLRHTFATRCVEARFDIKSLSEILGHSSVNITMNRYVHPTMELKRQNMQRLTCSFAVSSSRQNAQDY